MASAGKHADAPYRDNVIDGHGEHDFLEPEAAEYVPAPHNVQALELMPAANEPEGQMRQGEEAAEIADASAPEAPASATYVPAMQAMQSLA